MEPAGPFWHNNSLKIMIIMITKLGRCFFLYIRDAVLFIFFEALNEWHPCWNLNAGLIQVTRSNIQLD